MTADKSKEIVQRKAHDTTYIRLFHLTGLGASTRSYQRTRIE